MSGLVPVDRLYSAGVVVRDLEAATLRYAEIFGIDEWDVREFGPDRVTGATAYGRQAEPAFRTATGATVAPGEGATVLGNPLVPVTFELVQPLRGESPFEWFRFHRGQGVSHLTLSVREAGEFGAIRERLARSGVRIAASMTIDGQLERHFIDTRTALGGYLVEVQVPLRARGESDVAVTERWNHAGRYTRPDGIGPVSVQGVNHFGVVVNDVVESLERYDQILGISKWSVRDWRTALGGRWLEDPFYRGEQVNHEYISAMQPIADFGFEIVQPTLGPSHYNREFRDLYGQGLHHMLLTVTADTAEWDVTRDWLASVDVPLAMGADLFDRAGAFCYYDTFDALGGYILEAVLMRGRPAMENLAPDFVIDFAALAAQA